MREALRGTGNESRVLADDAVASNTKDNANKGKKTVAANLDMGII
jgi:hypothetical protein